jgi:hypothetical protein
MALAGARVAEQDDNWFKQGGGLTGDKFAY